MRAIEGLENLLRISCAKDCGERVTSEKHLGLSRAHCLGFGFGGRRWARVSGNSFSRPHHSIERTRTLTAVFSRRNFVEAVICEVCGTKYSASFELHQGRTIVDQEQAAETGVNWTDAIGSWKKGNEGAWFVIMATLVSLQLVRVAGVRDHHATSFSVSGRRPRVVLHSRPLHGSGLKITSQARVGSLQGGGAFCCPLWSHLLISKSNARVRASRLQIAASSIRPSPTEQEIKQIGAIFVNYGGHLLRRIGALIHRCPPLVVDVAPAVGLVAYSIWGLGPTTRMLRKTVFKRNDKKWDESRTYNVMASYMRPILLWIGIILICRAFDPVMLGTEASQAIKQRFVNFVRSLSTVLAFAFCTASLTQQVQRFMLENQDAEDSRNVGVQFIGNTVYTSVWVAAVCLFMELLGFSTQKWITAGGFGTVLITLAGREIFTNFLSSIMIHATRPFVDNEWIQTKIEGQEVSGTVEHVGWWSPTVIRGDDREAVHIPNHKFSVSVVRNLSQKTHWRIKTHLGISHLDVSKMNPIVADMRKVLAKHPQVEQRRLHRRVFFDQIDPENQALMILISAFVKTSHFEEYLRVKEIILLDLLKVISHHGARLATPIRSVQRVLDETESRSSPFRDMRNANHSQRRPLLLLDSQVASSDEDEDDKDDIQDTILRLSEQLAKDDKAAASTKDNENEESAKEPSDLEPPKPKEVVANGTLQTPVPVQQNEDPTSSADSLPLETDVRENLGRTYAGTEETLVHTDMGSLHENGHPVAATHVPATELVVEMPEEKVSHLYSNNVGLADIDASPESETSLPSIKINVHSDLTNQDVNTATTTTGEHQVQITHAKNVGIHVDIGSSTTSIIDDSWKEPDSSERDDNSANGEEALENVHSVHGDLTDHAASAETTTTEEHKMQITQNVNDKHVGVHVSVGNSATSIDDPWKQPSTSERDQNNAIGIDEALEHVHSVLTGEAAASLTTTEEHQVHVTQKVNDKHVGVHVAVGNSTTTTTIDDPWKQPSSSKSDAMNAIRKEEALEDVHSDLTDEAAASLAITEEHQVHVTQKVNDKNVGLHVAVGSSTTTTTIDDPWKEPSTSERDAKNVSRGEEALEDVHSDLTDEAAAFVRTTEQHQVEITQNVNDMHVGVHVAVGESTATTTIDDPWKISERDGNNASGEEALEAAAARSSDPWRESPASTSASSSSGDPWTQQSTVHNAQKAAAPSRPTVDPNLIPGVAIEGPKHTLPLDEDIALLDDSPTLVALGNPKSSKERRESAAGPKGGASRDTDRD